MKANIMLALLLFSSLADANFKTAELIGQRLTEKNEDELYYSSIPYAVARQGLRAIDTEALVVGYAEISDAVVSLSDQLQIVVTRKSDRLPIHSWYIERWVNEPLDELLITEYIGINRKFSSSYGTNTRYSLGCLAETSMRYGDIDQDSKEDLVLLLGPDFVLFSPDHERIVFSLRYATDNWMDKVDTEIYFEDYGFSTPEDMPFSQWDVLADLREPDPSFRGYAKVFIGDVDGDEHKDFIVWRKLYRSNMRRDGVDGFHLLSDTFFHYELDLEAQAESEAGVTGEYLPQDTPEEDIKNWLAENNLTWSKGYPSKSECPGEEGQLISEMHDPLLNDPDVLK